MTNLKIVCNLLNEDITAINSPKFAKLIEEILYKGFSDKGIDIEILELHRSDIDD
jgi:hypothetical protein